MGRASVFVPNVGFSMNVSDVEVDLSQLLLPKGEFKKQEEVGSIGQVALEKSNTLWGEIVYKVVQNDGFRARHRVSKRYSSVRKGIWTDLCRLQRLLVWEKEDKRKVVSASTCFVAVIEWNIYLQSYIQGDTCYLMRSSVSFLISFFK